MKNFLRVVSVIALAAVAGYELYLSHGEHGLTLFILGLLLVLVFE